MKILLIASIFFAGFVPAAKAQQPEIFSPDGKALRGYDVVAIFKSGTEIKGSDSLQYQWKGASWLFRNRANLDSFAANPEKFAPCYGGYCAYGMSNGYKAPTEISAWSVVNGKLYFNYNKKVQDGWTKNREALIKKADDNWPTIKSK